MRVVAPSSVPAGGGEFDVRIEIEGAQDLGAYEWWIRYDRNVVELTQPPKSAISDGGFLDDTGRSVSCYTLLPPSPTLEPGNVRFGCVTGGTAPGVSGNGLLSTISFVPVAGGSPNIQFVCAGLAVTDPSAENPPVSNVPECVSPTTPTPGSGDTPVPTSTPTPGGPTATATPTGPLPTLTPVPPGLEAVDLMAGCNPVASTYPDATPIQTIASNVGRTGILTSVWKFDLGSWLGYSPQFPEVSDLTEADFLDAVFICVNSPGAFVRPVV
ncbi:MAG: cohesin domain-containing protein [Dehalococcoidia bacterium]